jgi:hypothetical protein
VIFPEADGSSPSMALSIVDFPEPLGVVKDQPAADKVRAFWVLLYFLI